METICKACALVGAVAESLQAQGWTGCRKMLQIFQDELNSNAPIKDRTQRELAEELCLDIACEQAATGWVDAGTPEHPAGRKFNDILMTKGTTKCKFFEPK